MQVSIGNIAYVMKICFKFFLNAFTLSLSLIPGDPVNVALLSEGASCQFSVPDLSGNDDSDCKGAFDGVPSSSSTFFRFAFFGDPLQVWLKVTFDDKYLVTSARLIQLYFVQETNLQTILLQFDSDSSPSQQVSLFSKPLEVFKKIKFNQSYRTSDYDLLLN